MQQPEIQPLRDVHHDGLNNVCRSCDKTAELIARAEAAGYDVSQAKLINQQQQEMAKATKAQFFPDRA